METKFMATHTRWLAVLAAAYWLSAAALQADLIRYEAQPTGSKVQIDGTSTIHDWTVHSQLIGGFMELDSAFAKDPSFKAEPGLKLTPKVEVVILVRSIKSDKKRMDEVMHEAMKQKQYPRIEYRLSEMVLKKAPENPAGPYEFDTKGELTVSGVKKTIEMPVALERVGPAQIKASGKTSLKMTDFGIKPPAPSLALGLIKTGDDVQVSFEWLTAESKKPVQAAVGAAQ